MRIAVSVHGRFHAFDLARELQQQGATVSVATTYPAFIARRWLPPSIALHSAPLLEAARRSTLHLRWLAPTDVWIATRFARFAARSLPPSGDIFVGWSSAMLEAIGAARARGMRVVIERGSTHIAHQAQVLAEEYASRGISGQPAVDPRIIERETAEYADADAIMVPTGFAAQTFVRNGVSREKLHVNPYGVDLGRFAAMPMERPRRERTRVLFVGRVGLRKGVSYLLEAFAAAPSPFELHLAGPIEPEIKSFLSGSGGDRVHVHGPLRGAALDAQFRDADIFCLPSLEEGLSLALLEAMAAGLPVIATPETGAEDVIVSGQDGLIVPARDPEAIAAALAGLETREQRLALGAAARARVATRFTWTDYGERAMAAYRKLLN